MKLPLLSGRQVLSTLRRLLVFITYASNALSGELLDQYQKNIEKKEDGQMTKKEKFYKVIESNRKYLDELGVISIGIFGSVARGEDSEDSDYDILVEFKKGKKSFKTFTALCDLLEDCLGENYELITKESLSPYISPYILKEVENVKIAS